MPILVTCPACGCHLTAPVTAAGERASCPDCSTVIAIPGLPGAAVADTAIARDLTTPAGSDASETIKVLEELIEIVDSTPANPRTKRCPFCGESILKVARKCKHCGEFVERPRRLSGAHHKDLVDPLAVVAFATGGMSLLLIPFLLVPICVVSASLSYFRRLEDPHLKGKWLCLFGAASAVVAIACVLTLIRDTPPLLEDLLVIDWQRVTAAE